MLHLKRYKKNHHVVFADRRSKLLSLLRPKRLPYLNYTPANEKVLHSMDIGNVIAVTTVVVASKKLKLVSSVGLLGRYSIITCKEL